MMDSFDEFIEGELGGIRELGLWKGERVLQGAQGARVDVPGREGVLNLCANNYLGLADHPEIVGAAREALGKWGFGMASVRFICGTQALHRELEEAISGFLGTEDTIVYSSCFAAAGGLFAALLGPEDAVVSDELNHACIIDGIRLCKASRYRYANNDMGDLEARLKDARGAGARHVMIVTDGVFSMDGYVVKLSEMCDLAERYEALVVVDDSHAVGFVGAGGRGTPEQCEVMGRVDILLGTLGKALSGGNGGYASGSKAVVEMLRQRSRPYLFSNSIAPPVAAASLKALELVQGEEGTRLRERLWENTAYFRGELEGFGFELLEAEHPIVAVMLHDAKVAVEMSERLLEKGVYVIAFSYPVVPEGEARIRVQVNASHSRDDLEFAVRCFGEVKTEMGV
ncbi:MAG: glycine C-acetyltransferase [Verrucomicrobiota bacterium]